MSPPPSRDRPDTAETVHRSFGGQLRQLRMKAGLTQVDLGAKIGYSGGTVSDLERGVGRTVPDRDQVVGFIDACLSRFHESEAFRAVERASLLTDYDLLVRLDEHRRDSRVDNVAKRSSRTGPPTDSGRRRREPRPAADATDANRRLAAYRALARDIAPPDLLGRVDERAELDRFCTGDAGPAAEDRYQWWRGEPWAGKTALASSLAADPPDGVRVAAFFAGAQQVGQADATAFTEAMLDQLAALAGEPVPVATSAEGRDRERRLLVDLAAARLAELGETLLLIIDGLDEDVSAFPGSDRRSIASLLPPRPAGNVRVLVTSRHHPDLPIDVPEDHPLRRLQERVLVPSPFAAGKERSAKRDLLGHLSSGDPVRVDVIGFMVATGGGLSLDDLHALTKVPKAELAVLLQRSFGRIFNYLRPVSDDAASYHFAHETLGKVAAEYLSAEILRYRRRLFEWAESYRLAGWPLATPRYLLQPYGRLLISTADLPTLTRLSRNPARYDCMLAADGTDHDALTELAEIRRRLVTGHPDLGALAGISLFADRLRHRNQHIPARLPALLARLGRLAQADALARTIPDAEARANALVTLLEVVDHDDPDVALDRSHLVESLLDGIAWWQRDRIVERLIESLLATGRLHLAERVVRRFPALGGSGGHAVTLARIALATAGTDLAKASNLLDEAERMANSHSWRVHILCDVGRVEAGFDRGRAMELLATAESVAPTLEEKVTFYEGHSSHTSYPRANAWEKLAETLSDLGEAATAERIAWLLPEYSSRWMVLARIARTLDRTDHTAALAVARRIQKSAWDNRDAMLVLVSLLRDLGDFDGARVTASRLVVTLEAADGRLWGHYAVKIGHALVGVDDDQALRYAVEAENQALNPPELPEYVALLPEQVQNPRLAAAAGLWVAMAEFGRARRLADSITDSAWQITALVDIALSAGDPDTLMSIYHQLDELQIDLTDHASWYPRGFREAPESPARSIIRFSALLASRGRFDDAERILRRHPDGLRIEGLLRIADEAADADPNLALRLADEIARTARLVDQPNWKTHILTSVISEAVATGNLHLAEQLAQAIPAKAVQVAALIEIAEAYLKAGQKDPAARLVQPFAATLTSLPYSFDRAHILTALAKIFSALGWGSAAAAARDELAPRRGPGGRRFGDRHDDDRWADLMASHAETAVERRDFLEAVQLGIALIVGIPRRAAEVEVARVIRALIRADAHEQAEEIVEAVTNPRLRAPLLVAMADALAGTSDLIGAKRVAESIAPVREACVAFTALAVVARATDPQMASRFAARAMIELDRINSSWVRGITTEAMVRAVGPTDPAIVLRLADRGETLARSLPTDWQRGKRLASLSEALLDAGHPDAAEAVARQIPNDSARWRQQAEVAVRSHDPDQVRRLTADLPPPHPDTNPASIEDLADFHRKRENDRILELASTALAACGDIDRARHLVLAIDDDRLRALGLARCASGAAHYRPDQALSLADQARDMLIHLDDDYGQRARALADVAQTLVASGDSTLGAAARRLLASALALPGWTTALPALTRLDPGAIRSLSEATLTVAVGARTAT